MRFWRVHGSGIPIAQKWQLSQTGELGSQMITQMVIVPLSGLPSSIDGSMRLARISSNLYAKWGEEIILQNTTYIFNILRKISMYCREKK